MAVLDTVKGLLRKIDWLGWLRRFLLSYVAVIVLFFAYMFFQNPRTSVGYCLTALKGFFFNLNEVRILAILAVALLILVLTLRGIVLGFISKQLSVGWKLLVLSLLIIIGLEAQYIHRDAKQPPFLPGLFFFDEIDGYITAKGTFLSDTTLAQPNQTSLIECDRSKGECSDVTAFWDRYALDIFSTHWKIKSWTQEEVTFYDNSSSECVSYTMHIDRKNKAVTQQRHTKEPKVGVCKDFIDSEPIFLHLGDALKARQQKK